MDFSSVEPPSGNMHLDIMEENDARQYGGGMGVWLGFWFWCTIGSISLGFLISLLIIALQM